MNFGKGFAATRRGEAAALKSDILQISERKNRKLWVVAKKLIRMGVAANDSTISVLDIQYSCSRRSRADSTARLRISFNPWYSEEEEKRGR
jgi:hypothetical protein